MKKLSVFTTSTLTAAMLLTSLSTQAAGFQLDAQSATGLGRAYAGDGIIADNASVMAINPAAMSMFDKTSFSMGATSVTSQIAVSDATYSSYLSWKKDVSANYDNAGGTDVVPNMYLIVPVNDKWALGAGLYSNFGTTTKFDSSYVAKEYGGKTKVLSGELALAASYRLNDQWSFGAGIDLIYGVGTFNRSIDIKMNDGPFIKPDYHTHTINMADIKADGFGVGWNTGIAYELDENNRWGFSYHHSPKITAKGDFDGVIGKASSEIYLPLPDFANFSGYNRFAGTPFAISYSIQWTGWNVFDKLDTNTNTIQNFEWNNTWHYSLGGTYYMNDQWTLRAGYMYDQGAQGKEVRTIAVPDSNRQWFSAGVSYAPTKDSSIDFGFTYLLGQDMHVHQNSIVTSIDATTRANAIIAGVQYSKSF
ncbi:transporter [Vibrio sp. S11_S32]|uniref:outer membrane protein transport protein n=1 Tax=Vibrio sp. S11_S32 TaxID=2720225 RepID=UPI001680B6E9|nr:outer membrane protein transport protein [Vibrio sp. S11_S32]MBD1574960.1 transporter [Vibrio sp. S11_S32]